MISKEIASSDKKTRRSKRYNLALPEDLYTQVIEVAQGENTTVVTVLRRFISLGLMALKIDERGGQLLIREKEKPDQLIKFL